MTQVAVQVSDRESADTLVELRSSFDLDFVEQILIEDASNGGAEPIEPYLGPEYQQMLVEEAAFDRLLPTLKQMYLHQFVAIYQQQIIDHDVDEIRLVERIDEAYPNAVVLIRQVSDEPEPMLFFRSPRLIS